MLKNKKLVAFCLIGLFAIVMVACGMKSRILSLEHMRKVQAFYILVVLAGIATTGVLAYKVFRTKEQSEEPKAAVKTRVT